MQSASVHPHSSQGRDSETIPWLSVSSRSGDVSQPDKGRDGRTGVGGGDRRFADVGAGGDVSLGATWGSIVYTVVTSVTFAGDGRPYETFFKETSRASQILLTDTRLRLRARSDVCRWMRRCTRPDTRPSSVSLIGVRSSPYSFSCLGLHFWVRLASPGTSVTIHSPLLALQSFSTWLTSLPDPRLRSCARSGACVYVHTFAVLIVAVLSAGLGGHVKLVVPPTWLSFHSRSGVAVSRRSLL